MLNLKEQKQALLDWADILERVPEHKFDMCYFASPCGTIACVAGWATAVPLLQREGWHLAKVQGVLERWSFRAHGKFSPVETATELFVKVHWREFDYLFYDWEQTKTQAVSKLREFASRYSCRGI